MKFYISVQFSSVTQSCPTLCDPTDCSTPGLSVHHQLLEFTQTHVHWVGDAIQPSHPLLSPSPPTFNLSQLQGLFNESVLHIRRPKYWHFSFNISPSNEYSGLISFRMDWLDLLAVPGILKSLLQHHSSKASILQHSAFFVVQLSHPYMTTGKTISLTRWTFVGKGMCLLFNMVSRLVTTFLPRSKHLNFMAPVTICSDFGAPQNEVCHCFTFICHSIIFTIIFSSECCRTVQSLCSIMWHFWTQFLIWLLRDCVSDLELENSQSWQYQLLNVCLLEKV